MAQTIPNKLLYSQLQDVTLASLRAGKAEELVQRLHDPSCRASARASIKNIDRSQPPEASARQLRRSGSAPQLTSSPRRGDTRAGHATRAFQTLRHGTNSNKSLTRGASAPNLH
eukprot:2548347-Amphidinium_carterae.1